MKGGSSPAVQMIAKAAPKAEVEAGAEERESDNLKVSLQVRDPTVDPAMLDASGVLRT